MRLYLVTIAALTLSGCDLGFDIEAKKKANLNLICFPRYHYSVSYPSNWKDDFKRIELSDPKENGDVLRFGSSKIFIYDPKRPKGEYEYGDVFEIEGATDMYRSGLKTISFRGTDHETAIVAHSDQHSSSLTIYRCVAGKK